MKECVASCAGLWTLSLISVNISDLKFFFTQSHHTVQTLRECHSAFYSMGRCYIILIITWNYLPVKTHPKDVREPWRMQPIL